jgi:hypothetical protein
MLSHVTLDQTVGKRIRKTYLSGDRFVLVFDNCYANVDFDEDGADDCVVLWLHNRESDDCYANVEFDEDGADDCVVLWLHNRESI